MEGEGQSSLLYQNHQYFSLAGSGVELNRSGRLVAKSLYTLEA